MKYHLPVQLLALWPLLSQQLLPWSHLDLMILSVCDAIGLLPTVEAELGSNSNCIEADDMLAKLMSEPLAKDTKLLQPPVYSLVASKGLVHSTGVSV